MSSRESWNSRRSNDRHYDRDRDRSRDYSRRDRDSDRHLDYRSRDRNRDSGTRDNSRYSNSAPKWKDTYKAGNQDGKFGQTVYPIQSRTQSGTFEQHDYTKSNFKKECGITKLPKESSTPVIKEPEYGLKWNDEESDENEGASEQGQHYQIPPGGQFHDDDNVNSFQDPHKKKKRRRRRGRSKTPEGELNEFEKRRKEIRDKKREEWDAVKTLPKGSGKLENTENSGNKSGEEEDGGSFSGFSGKAKWGKRHAKRRAKVANMPIAPVMFQKASGVLGDASLEEKKVESNFEEMSEFEKKKKIEELEQKLKQDQNSFQMWSQDYLEWFKINVTDKGFCKDQDPIEYLKSAEKEGLTKDYAMVVNGSKLRQYYLTFKIVSNKKEKVSKELSKLKSKMEPKSEEA